MKNLFDVMTQVVFPLVVTATRAAIKPALGKKGIQVIDHGADLGEVVTNMDLSASSFILNGNGEFGGLSALHPASFSEEADSGLRPFALKAFQVDPCDGTGDAVKTAGTDALIGPTTLVSLLERTELSRNFMSRVGLIFDVLGEYAAIIMGGECKIGKADQAGNWVEVKLKRTEVDTTSVPRIGIRRSYPQNYGDIEFPAFLLQKGVEVIQVPVGGAGTQILQFLRSVFEPENPEDLPAFAELDWINAIFNRQPDWKTWDTDPIGPFSQSGHMTRPRNIYGRPLVGNAANAELKDMHHRQGWVVARRTSMVTMLTRAANAFDQSYGAGSLLTKDY